MKLHLLIIVVFASIIVLTNGCRGNDRACRSVELDGLAVNDEVSLQEGIGVVIPEKEENPAHVLKERVSTVLLDSSGKFLYAGSSAGLVIYNVSETSHPEEIATIFLPGSVTSIVQYGDFLLVSSGPEGIAVINVKDKKNPVLKGTIETPGGALKGVVLSHSKIIRERLQDPPVIITAFAIADGAMGITILRADWAFEGEEWKDKESKILSSWKEGGYVRDILLENAREGNFIFSATEKEGIVLLEYSISGELKVLSKIPCENEVRSIDIAGNYVYAVSGESLLVIKREGKELKLVSNLKMSLGDAIRGIGFDDLGKKAFLTAGEAGIVIVDIDNHREPRKVGVFDYSKPTLRINIKQNIAFIAADSGGILVLDISTPPQFKILFPKS